MSALLRKQPYPALDLLVERWVQLLPVILQGANRISGDASSRLDLSPSQMHALGRLLDSDSMTMSELGECLAISMSAVTAVVDRLEARDLVRRHRTAQDRRVVTVSLTPNGETSARELRHVIREQTRALLGLLNESEARSMLSVMEKLAGLLPGAKKDIF